MTQFQSAQRGDKTPQIKAVAREEGVGEEKLRKRVAQGKVVIPRNVMRENKAVGIGEGLKVKVNANLGTSPESIQPEEEVEKAEVALRYGADTIMDLSIGGDLKAIRKNFLKLKTPLGTVPIYEAAVEAERAGKPVVDLGSEDFFRVIESQAKEGVDFMTIHAGITFEGLERLENQKRLTGIVSRGGAITASWMRHTGNENPFFQDYDHLLEIARDYDVTLSLGDALRPGSTQDATDRAQVQELLTIGELVERAWNSGVQAMVEGPGHMPLDQIKANVTLQKKLCKNAPFYVLGPLVTDIAPGYDHISGAIGGAVAALAGADFLCYVTPAEHLALPGIEDVREGVVASKIAAHSADITRGIDLKRDIEMSTARYSLDWENQFRLCIDPEKARKYRGKKEPEERETCTMCGAFCAMKLSSSFLE